VTRHERLPRARRVRKRSQYLAIQGEGRRLVGTHYILMARRADEPAAALRFGITVSRKVGGAVIRNQVKRWIRESWRRMQDDLPRGLDVVVLARPSASTAGYGTTARELATLARRLGR
jgi:ribonuclease P protein component